MGAGRIELTGFTDQMRDRLVAYGLFHEIISWKLRMFRGRQTQPDWLSSPRSWTAIRSRASPSGPAA